MERENTFRKGRNYIEMVLLSFLSDDDYYGYELMQLVREYSEGKLLLHESSLYPALYRLENEGYVTSTKKPSGERKKRVYYHLESKGRARLAKLVADYEYIKDAIDMILLRGTTDVEVKENE